MPSLHGQSLRPASTGGREARLCESRNSREKTFRVANFLTKCVSCGGLPNKLRFVWRIPSFLSFVWHTKRTFAGISLAKREKPGRPPRQARKAGKAPSPNAKRNDAHLAKREKRDAAPFTSPSVPETTSDAMVRHRSTARFESAQRIVPHGSHANGAALRNVIYYRTASREAARYPAT
jgi:hypothetical protein